MKTIHKWFTKNQNKEQRSGLLSLLTNLYNDSRNDYTATISNPSLYSEDIFDALTYMGSHKSTTVPMTIDFYKQSSANDIDAKIVDTRITAFVSIQQGIFRGDTYIIYFQLDLPKNRYCLLTVQDPITGTLFDEEASDLLYSHMIYDQATLVRHIIDAVHPLQEIIMSNQTTTCDPYLALHNEGSIIADIHSYSKDQEFINYIPVNSKQYMLWFAQALPRRADWSLTNNQSFKKCYFHHKQPQALIGIMLDQEGLFETLYFVPAVNDGLLFKNAQTTEHFIVDKLTEEMERELMYFNNNAYGPIQQQLSLLKQIKIQTWLNTYE